MRLWRRVGVDSLRPETKERGRGRQVVMTSTPVPVGWALAIRTGEVRDIGCGNRVAPRGRVHGGTQHVLVNQRGAFVRVPGDCGETARERERQVVMTSLPVASALRSRREIGIR